MKETENETLQGDLLGEWELTVAHLAVACRVEQTWVETHAAEGLFPMAEQVEGVWCFSPTALLRARRMLQMERDFEAVPELAALVADMLEEMDALKTRLESVGRR